MSSYYAQAIAEELNVRPETISLILATPTGRPTAVFGRVIFGMANVRKVAAYTINAAGAGRCVNLASGFEPLCG